MYAGRTPPRGTGHLGGCPPGHGALDAVATGPGGGAERTPLDLVLQPDVLTDVEDAAGRWQHERGWVIDHGVRVGFYASTIHLVPAGTEAGAEAGCTLTIFFHGSTPPETITVHGTYHADSDSETGTVSVASAGYARRVGSRFRRSGNTVTID